jgi:hypothetical protein
LRVESRVLGRAADVDESRTIGRGCQMEYKVHRLEIRMKDDQDRLERFLNGLRGEIVSIIPNVKNTTLAQIYGMTRKIDFLLVVEKIGSSK